ncbi:MAG: hypothetical protein RR844_09355, partial [Clostridium sp.]
IKSYILGSIMGHLLYQRNVLAIHGGSVVIDNKAVIIVGESGSGKSTVTTALRLKGYKLLTDDIASVSMDKEVFVNPGYPGQRLCDNVMNYFNYDLDKYRRIDLNHKVKYMIPTWEEFAYEKTNLGTICELKAAEVDEPFIEEIKGRDKVNLLYDNGYILRWVRHLGMKPDYVRQCVQVAKQVKMYRITRPKTGFTVGEQVELLESILFKAKSEELKYIIA